MIESTYIQNILFFIFVWYMHNIKPESKLMMFIQKELNISCCTPTINGCTMSLNLKLKYWNLMSLKYKLFDFKKLTYMWNYILFYVAFSLPLVCFHVCTRVETYQENISHFAFVLVIIYFCWRLTIQVTKFSWLVWWKTLMYVLDQILEISFPSISFICTSYLFCG